MRSDQTTQMGITMQHNDSGPLRPSRRVVLGSGAAAAAALALPASTASAAPAPRPWGARVAVHWGEVTWAGGSYAVPHSMTLHAVGPGPVPAGTIIMATVDAAAVQRLSAGPAVGDDEQPVRGSVRTSRPGGVVRLEWTLAQALPAGSRVEVTLEHVAQPVAGPLASVHHPVVEVVGAPGALAAQVATGRESATRQDDVTDALAL